MSIKNNFPVLSPSIVLDFANSKTIDYRLQYSRTSSATFTDEDGYVKTATTGIPRFDHDPITRRCRGLLLEESRINQLGYSDPGNAYWTLDNAGTGGAKTANTSETLDPAGTNTALKLTSANAANSSTQIYRNLALASTGVQSVWAKAGTASTLGIYKFNGNAGVGAWFNLSTGQHRVTTATTASAAGEQSSSGSFTSRMIAYPNGWYRCIFRDTSTNMSYMHMRICDFGSDTKANAANEYLYLWGVQAEASGATFATSFIPTTAGSAVTRSADVLTMSFSNVSTWYKQIEGTYVASFYNYAPAGAATRILVDSGVTNSVNFYMSDSTTIQTGINGAIGGNGLTIPSNQMVKVASSWSTPNSLMRTHSNNTQNGNSTSISPSLSNTLYFGNRNDGLQINSALGRIEYYPSYLTDSQVRYLTTF
jgi:hypothetical protein